MQNVICKSCGKSVLSKFLRGGQASAKQTAKHKEMITFVRSLISLISESLKKINH